MSRLTAFFRRFLGLFQKRRHEAAMKAEIQAHLDALTERNIDAGMSSEEARYAALRAFGGVEQIKERARDERGIIWLEQFLQDLRYGVRQLRKAPGFAAVAILTLALSIGTTTAIFSVLHGVILRPLPYPQPERLVALSETFPPDGQTAAPSWGAYYYWARHASSFAGIAASRFDSANLTGVNDSERVTLLQVTPNYFSTLGFSLLHGRGFREEEATPGQETVAVISHWFWVKKFSAREDLLNQTITLNDRTFTIVGIMPPDEQIDRAPHFFVPRALTAADQESFSRTPERPDTVVARLKPKVTVSEATAELNVLSRALAVEHPATNAGHGVQLTSLIDDVLEHSGYMLRGVRPLLFTLFGAVAFLLLIACANIANLLFARATVRKKEIVMRAALGASRGRIARQLLCESLLLALLGGIGGLVLAYWSIDLLKPLTGSLPRSSGIALDGHALAFSLFVTLVTGLAFGLLPTWSASRVDLADGMKTGASGDERSSQRLRSGLITLEVALALLLLTGAGLLGNSFVQLQRVKVGFRPAGVFANRLELPEKSYGSAAQKSALVEQLTERMSQLPNVDAVAFTTGMPIFGTFGIAFKIEHAAADDPQPFKPASHSIITPDYFRALGIPLVAGRTFDPSDLANALPVAIVSENVARRFFPHQNPIGQRIMLSRGAKVWREIVGVVGNVKQWGPASEALVGAVPGSVYEPFAQNPTTQNLLLVAHTTDTAAEIPLALRAVLHQVDPRLPLTNMFPLEAGVANSIAKFRLSMWLFLIFAGIALLLAAIGVYGVIAYNVAQRTREIGVRISLGAQRAAIFRLILAHAGKRVGLGLLIGICAALALSRLLRSWLFHVSPVDPLTFTAVTILLTLVAFLACWLPARRATKVDPMVALRCE